MRPAPAPRRRGVSLVGFLVAVSVLSFVLIPFYMAFQTSRTGTVRSLNALVATNVASSVLERYRSKPFKTLDYLLLGYDPENPPATTQVINGPFEAWPPQPDVIEREVHRSGVTVFDAEIWLSYFPNPNPSPDGADLVTARQRILIRVLVRWQDRMARGNLLTQEFSLSTIVHNEAFSNKPSLRRLTTRGEDGVE